MVDIHLSGWESVLYALCFILVLFGLGYMTALIDFVRGFTREEAKKTEEQIRKCLGEVYGEVKDDTAHTVPTNRIQLRNKVTAHTTLKE
jgi:uncharacterized protein YjeT (DUF2065 family)